MTNARILSARLLAVVTCFCCWSVAGAIQAQAETKRPNIVVIMADDFGYECVGANGSTSYKTPTLDRLAATGMRFEHCYVQPLCTPTRVQLMTGMYNVRNYVKFGWIDPESVTFANILKQAGYATCIAGKWQLGQDVDLPKKLGFDESYLWQHTRRPERYKNPGLEINGVQKDWSDGEYGPDLVSDYALDFIKRKKDGPFFLYYPMMLTHAPYTPTPDSSDYDGAQPGQKKAKKKNKKTQDEPTTSRTIAERHFTDMVAYADKMVGKLLAQLDDLQIRDNTLVIFLGDNGTGRGTRSMLNNQEFIGGKGLLTHRGMHVPLIVSWPGKLSAGGQISQDLVDSTDILPTICEAAGVAIPSELKLDGHSFCPQLRGERGSPRQWYYSWYSPHGVFVGEFAANHQFKLYRDGKLFDLKQDPDEQQPLKAESLSAEASSAAKQLQLVLDQYQQARPLKLANPTGRVGKAKKRGASDE